LKPVMFGGMQNIFKITTDRENLLLSVEAELTGSTLIKIPLKEKYVHKEYVNLSIDLNRLVGIPKGYTVNVNIDHRDRLIFVNEEDNSTIIIMSEEF